MNCKQARGLFSGGMDNELRPPEGRELHQHLLACPQCEARWRSFQATVRMVRSLPQAEPDPSFVGQVLDRVRAYEAGQRVEVRRMEGSGLADRLRAAILWVSGTWVVMPARLAGAAAFGLLAGFLATQWGVLPLASSGSHLAVVSASDPAQPGGNRSLASTPATLRGDRPFADLASEVTAARLDDPGTDSTSGGSPASLPDDPAFPSDDTQSPGRQVLLSAPDGHPQITF